MVKKLLYVKLCRFGGCPNWESPTVTKTPSSRSLSPGSARKETGWAAQAPGSSQVQPQTGRHATTTHHNRGSTNSQKTLLFQVAKRYQFLWGPWQGGGRCGVGLGSAHYKKSKAFIKKAINWYQKKTQGGLQEEAEREAGRARDQHRGPRKTSSEGRCRGAGTLIQSAYRGLPPTPPEVDGQGLWPGGTQPSPHRGPHGDGHCLRLPGGKDLQQTQEKRLDGDVGAEGTLHLPARAPLCEAQHEGGPAGTSSLVSAPQGCQTRRASGPHSGHHP